MFRHEQAFSKEDSLSKLKNFQRELERVSNASLQPVVSTALIPEAQKDLTTEKASPGEMFRLLPEGLRCRIRSEAIRKCKLPSLPPPIPNIPIWRIDDLYCGILADEPRSIQGLKIRRAGNLVRLVMSQSGKSLLVDEHGHFCELSQVLFTDEFKTVTERAAKFDQYIDQEMASLERNHAAFLQSLREWAVKRAVWEYATVLNWYTSNSKDYLWPLGPEETYNLLNEWRPVVTEGQAHFRKPLPAIDELFGSTDRPLSSQRQLRSFEYPLSKDKDLHMLRGQFAQMTVYPRRPIEKDKDTSVPKPISTQQSFQTDSRSQSVPKTAVQQKSSRIESIPKSQSKPVTSQKPFHDTISGSAAFVPGIRLVPHTGSHSIQSPSGVQSTASASGLISQPGHNVCSSIETDQYSHALLSQSLISPLPNVQPVSPSLGIDPQLALNYLSNRRHRSSRGDARSSPAYSPPPAGFVFEPSKLSLPYEGNIRDMEFNATDLNLDPDDPDDAVKLAQARLYPTIDLTNSPTRSLTQMIPTKRTQDGPSDFDNPKRPRPENANLEPTEKEPLKWKFEYYTGPPETGYSSYSGKPKGKGKEKAKEK